MTAKRARITVELWHQGPVVEAVAELIRRLGASTGHDRLLTVAVLMSTLKELDDDGG